MQCKRTQYWGSALESLVVVSTDALLALLAERLLEEGPASSCCARKASRSRVASVDAVAVRVIDLLGLNRAVAEEASEGISAEVASLLLTTSTDSGAAGVGGADASVVSSMFWESKKIVSLY